MSVGIQIIPRGFVKARRVLNKLSHLDTQDLLDDIGQLVENQVRRRIVDQEGPPEGGAWDEYSDEYEKWKAKKGKLSGAGKGFLRLEGGLLDSIEHVVSGDELEVGSNLIYANANQELRPYLGLSTENEDDVEEAIEDWLSREVGIKL